MTGTVKFDVFDFLEMESYQIVQALTELLNNYVQLDNEERLDEVSRIFLSIQSYLITQDAMLKAARMLDMDVESQVPGLDDAKRNILDLLNTLVMEHVDDDSFFSNLRNLKLFMESEASEEASNFYRFLRVNNSAIDVERLKTMLSSEIMLGR